MEDANWLVRPRSVAVEFDSSVSEALGTAAEELGVTAQEYVQRVVAAHLAAEAESKSHMSTDEPRCGPHAHPEALHSSVPDGGLAHPEALHGFAPDGGLGNIAYIRNLWVAFERGGVSAMAAMIPPHARWRPLDLADGALHGTRQLAEFWNGREINVPSMRMFHRVGDDVLVEAEYDDGARQTRTVWLLFRFEEDELVEAVAFADETEALSYCPTAAAVAAAAAAVA